MPHVLLLRWQGSETLAVSTYWHAPNYEAISPCNMQVLVAARQESYHPRLLQCAIRNQLQYPPSLPPTTGWTL